MPWTLDTDRGTSTLALSAQVDIFEAAQLHETLIGLARERQAVRVDLSACTDVDCSALQLLLAFRRSRAARPTAFTLGDGPPARLLRRLRLDAELGGAPS